jgi:hypothetical protein
MSIPPPRWKRLAGNWTVVGKRLSYNQAELDAFWVPLLERVKEAVRHGHD